MKIKFKDVTTGVTTVEPSGSYIIITHTLPLSVATAANQQSKPVSTKNGIIVPIVGRQLIGLKKKK